MKFEEIPAPRLSLRIKPKSSDAPLRAGDVLSLKTALVRGELYIRMKEAMVTVLPVASADINALTDALSTGRTILARLSDLAPDGSAMLELALFNGEMLEMGVVEVGVDERAVKAIRASGPKEAGVKLQGQSVFVHGGDNYFFIAAGGAANRYLESEDERRSFAVVGSDYGYALAENKDRGDGETIFLASRIHRLRNRIADNALRVAHGSLKFLDWTAVGGRALLVKAQMDKLAQEGGTYLQKWDKYGNVEGDIFLEKARRVGKISFTCKSEQRGEFKILKCGAMTPAQKTALSSTESIDVVNADEVPEYLNDSDMSFEQFASVIVDKERISGEKKESGKDDKKEETGKEKREKTFQIDSPGWFNPATGELQLKTDTAPVGDFIIMSVAGELTQIKRRMKARAAIQNGRAAIPHLGLLIQEDGKIPPSTPPPKIKPLSAAVLRKVFPKNDPTEVQEKAIEIALNTPDIALIQGPPGTGKTTVIAAIIERLNEEFDKRGELRGHVLLSGFQHDAVENMIDRLRINGLPVPKFGQRSGEEDDAAFSRFERQLRDWCMARAKELRSRNPQIGESVEEHALRIACVQYINAPTLSLAISLLSRALELSDLTLGEDLRKRLQDELKRLQMEESSARGENPLLPIVRTLRVTAAGFSDDGADRASDVLFALKGELDEKDKGLLSQASRWHDKQVDPPFLSELRALKGRLLKRFTPPPAFRIEKSRDSVVELVRETIERVRLFGLTSRDKPTAALSELLLEMENDLTGIQDAVTDYCFAYSSTCQQSVGGLMQKMKGVDVNSDDDGQKMVYDYVIVDEAARVSPRDLMIAMVQGKRIILVGDHRQLPQLIDEEVARRVEAGEESFGDKDWLKTSLFEHLFTERVKKLEEDGRTRHITLNAQFRTHPILGEFISQNFYDPQEHFDSPLPASTFAHHLPDVDGKCAVWLDVPKDQGEMSVAGTSRIRIAEADVICRQLKRWIEDDNVRAKEDGTKQLTFGVISFYKAQTEYIKKRLGAVDEDRLRIGTVDSFQGREFDVVFLSLVRTGKGFGFLECYNRLNVSMSRQKKMLVVVGDAAHYDTDVAREKVPGLYNFLKLCREKGVIREKSI